MAEERKSEFSEGDFVKINKSRAFNAVINYPEFNENLNLIDAEEAYEVYLVVNDSNKRGEDAEVCQACPYRTEGCNFDMIILEESEDLIWCGQFFDKTEKPEKKEEDTDKED